MDQTRGGGLTCGGQVRVGVRPGCSTWNWGVVNVAVEVSAQAVAKQRVL